MKAIKFILTFLWGLPQNILAIVFMWVLLVDFPCKFRDGAVIMRMSWKRGGGVTLGNFIFLCPSYYNREDIIKHELGHVRQSWILGPAYLLVIGLPSLLWAMTHNLVAPEKDYEWFYTERWADRLSEEISK